MYGFDYYAAASLNSVVPTASVMSAENSSIVCKSAALIVCKPTVLLTSTEANAREVFWVWGARPPRGTKNGVSRLSSNM